MYLGYSQVARHSFLVRLFKGSNPFIPKFYDNDSINRCLLENKTITIK